MTPGRRRKRKSRSRKRQPRRENEPRQVLPMGQKSGPRSTSKCWWEGQRNATAALRGASRGEVLARDVVDGSALCGPTSTSRAFPPPQAKTLKIEVRRG